MKTRLVRAWEDSARGNSQFLPGRKIGVSACMVAMGVCIDDGSYRFIRNAPDFFDQKRPSAGIFCAHHDDAMVFGDENRSIWPPSWMLKLSLIFLTLITFDPCSSRNGGGWNAETDTARAVMVVQ